MPSPGQMVIIAAAEPGLSLAQQFRALFRDDGGTAKDSWFDADKVNPTSDKIYSFEDHIDASHSLVQSTASAQVALPTADAALNGAKSAPFLTTSQNRYVSTRPASAWAYLSNGTGVTIYLTFVPTSVSVTGFPICTRTLTGTSTDTGAHMAVINAAVHTGCTAGGGVVFTSGGGTGGAFAIGTPTYVSSRYLEGAMPEWILAQRGAVMSSGNSSIAPSASAPGTTLSVGASFSGGAPAPMRFRALYLFRRVLSAAEDAIVKQYIAVDTGIAAF